MSRPIKLALFSSSQDPKLMMSSHSNANIPNSHHNCRLEAVKELTSSQSSTPTLRLLLQKRSQIKTRLRGIVKKYSISQDFLYRSSKRETNETTIISLNDCNAINLLTLLSLQPLSLFYYFRSFHVFLWPTDKSG